jgi:cytochrome b
MDVTFQKKYSSLTEVLVDKDLAKIGDALVNFVFSLAVSNTTKQPRSVRVSSLTLSTALKKAGLRELLPHRTDRHAQANAVEALIMHAWITKMISLTELLQILESEAHNPSEAFSNVLGEIKQTINQSMESTDEKI